MDNFIAQLKKASNAGILAGGYPFAENNWYVGSGTPLTASKRANTIQAALDNMVNRDILFIGPGSYDEQVVWPIGLNNVTVIGGGNRGDVSIAPSGTNKTALKIEGTATLTEGVTLINVGCEGDGTGGGLHVLGFIRKFRAYGCKFEGGAFAAQLQSNAAGAIGDTILEDIELAWATDALLIAVTGAGDPVTQTYLRNSLLHNYTSRGVRVTNTFTGDLWITKNVFARQEDGTQPTNEYIKADIAGTTGFVSENSFATPTNAATKLAIATNVIWGPNGTEAGWSTARPA